MLYSRICLKGDFRLIRQSHLIGIFSDTSCCIPAHLASGSIHVIHDHAKICDPAAPNQNQTIAANTKMTI